MIRLGLKSKLVLLMILVLLFASSPFRLEAGSSTYVSGDITSDTTWALANSPYIVTSDITVKNATTLVVEPGVTVKFYAGTGLNIGTTSENGTLISKGTDNNLIKFTSASDVPKSRDWKGINFVRPGNNVSVIEKSVIEYAWDGLKLNSSVMTITNNIFRDNYKAITASNSSLTVSNNTFSGGGVSVTGSFITFSKNKGGGVDGSNYSTLTVIDNEVGAVGVTTYSTAFIRNNKITGGIYLSKVSAGPQNPTGGSLSSAEIIDNVIGSINTYYAYGLWIRNNVITEGVSLNASHVVLDNNTITKEIAVYASNYAQITRNLVPGILFSYSWAPSPAVIANNMIIGGKFGVKFSGNSLVSIINNTITNQSESGIYLDSLNATITNNIISNNKYGIYTPVRTLPAPTISYNVIFGNSGNYVNVDAAASDISVDPRFVGNGDYHLRADSPAIDAGNPSSAPSIDYDGDQRPWPTGGRIDIGVDEYTPTGSRRPTGIAAPSAPPPQSLGEIFGRVVNSSWQPIPGTAVRINNIVIPTNPGGEFRFTLVYPGIYTIYYDAPGYISQTQVVEVKAGATTTPPTVVMSRLGEIYGKVINGRTRRPFRGAVVRINNVVMPTNRRGEFRFTQVYPGIYTIYYDAPGYRGQIQEVIPVYAERTTTTPTCILFP